jgi:hypothetical protein
MLEVLIAIVISVIGILGMIGLQMRTYQAEAESYQRSQALVISMTFPRGSRPIGRKLPPMSMMASVPVTPRIATRRSRRSSATFVRSATTSEEPMSPMPGARLAR